MSKSKSVDGFLRDKLSKADKKTLSSVQSQLKKENVSRAQDANLDDVKSQATPGHEWKGSNGSPSAKRWAGQSTRQASKDKSREPER